MMLGDKNYDVWFILERDYPAFLEEVRKVSELVYDKQAAMAQLTKVYRMFKEMIPEVYMEGEEYRIYGAMLTMILDVEDRLMGSQIIDVYPDFVYDKKHKLDHNLAHYSSPEELLDELVYSTRKKLVTSWASILDINTINMSNKCRSVSTTMVRRAKSMGITVKKVCIHPGYSEKSSLYHGDGFHYFNIVTIDDKDYIVDCSYAQFFYHGRNNLDRLGIVNLSGCNPGVYMLLDEDRRRVAEMLLKRGWIEATEENMINYLDGFTLMYRNGLYYENRGKADYSVDYSYDQYMNFLYGDDDQIQHEGRQFLGYQKKPLKDAHFKF